jgi:peptidyl-prolyl cis-trans isomerase C
MQILATLSARLRSVRGAGVQLALPLLISSALLPALAGCAPSATSDPVLALRVGDVPVTLSAFEQVLALFAASNALQTDASASKVGWQAPGDRTIVGSAKDQTVTFFVDTLTLKTELDQQHISVTQKDIDIATAALKAQLDSASAQLKRTPGNARLRQLVQAVTPDAIHWLALQGAYTTVFSQKGKAPTAQTRGILVKTLADAQAILAQLKGGADFAALAKAKSLDTQTGAKGGDLGTIYVGQFVAAFDRQVFDTEQNDRFLIVPFQGSYGVFEILSRGVSPLSAVGDASTEEQYLNAWIENVVAPHVAVENYVGK